MLSRARDTSPKRTPPAIALKGWSVRVEQRKAKAKVEAMARVTTATARPILPRAPAGGNVDNPLENAELLWRASTDSGCQPKAATPETSPATTTAATAAMENSAATRALQPSTRGRETGRASRLRREPNEASPATDSPAKTATARGMRKRRREFSPINTMVKPDDSGITEPQSPMRSGVGALVVPMITVTTTPTAASTPRRIQARGRRSCLMSSMTITRGCPCG
ncbi:MAG TPA: hypothetical protein VII46_05310 [Acidimicrobiales bacterium]